MDNRIFYHNYPNNPYIDVQYTAGNKVFRSRYKIIELGFYLQNVKYTQKRNNIQYQIPDEYIVKTEVANQVLRYETKYTIANKVLYTITWKEGRAKWKINREKSRLSRTHVFGFDIEILHQIQVGQSKESSKARTISKIIDKRKRPLNEIQLLLQQNKRYALFEREACKKVNHIILQYRMVSKSREPICLRSMELENGTNIINIKYNSTLDPIRLDAYIRACDEALLGRDGYRRLAAVEQPILDDDEYQENSDGIVVNEQEIGNGVYQSIRTLLQTLIPIWNKSVSPILQPGDTINLKLSGDGRNVDHKQNHVMLTFCLLNKKDEVLKPDHQHCICLYVGKEKYETLAKVGHLFKFQLSDLQENGIFVDGVHWSIELFFSGDWKFMYNIMGLNAPNSKYFCLYCDCDSSARWDINLKWKINKNTQSKKKPELFPAIRQENYIPDELHLLLRISDVLMECLFNDLFKKKDFERLIKSQIEQAMKSINVHFEFFKSKFHSGKWDWTSLMGPDKKKVLQHFPVTNFISGKRGEDIQELWRNFYDLYMIIRRPSLTDSEIDDLEVKVKEWIYLF
ncbi:hypothetical protein RirG_194510 [Rhizophagus irregularis DAOM 197198w]|uniref:Uncharacterized protein n=3 Tax=Rhizophagus irregularis TaxID=588596 RepID=A0A015LVZ4_RHIIW|nr:hypothetical protein RirG_194510 [Rhizophagus irregularis DAOM 197198w]